MAHKADRRTLRFESWDDAIAEISRLEASARAGTLRQGGAWTPGEIFEHVGKAVRFSLDGFPMEPLPAPIRWLGRMILKPRTLHRGFPRGTPLKGGAVAFLPAPGTGLDAGLKALREQIGRVRCGERMSHASPLFGPLTQDEWTRIHLNHAAHHFGFLHPQ